MAGYKRNIKDDKWRLEYQIDWQKYSKTVKADSPSKADKLLALFIAEIESGQYKKENSITFVEFAQLFLDKYAKPNLSETTVRDYTHRLNKYILDEFGNKKITSIKRIQVQAFANKLVEEHNLSSKTVKNYIKLISSIINKAIEWDYMYNDNPADKVNIPKNLNKSKKKVILYSYDEIVLFLNKLEELKDEELKIAIYISFFTGARRGEVLALNFNDIDFNICTIDLNKNKIAVPNGTKLKDIKTGKPRLFYVPQVLIDKVNNYYNIKRCPSKTTAMFTMHPDTYTYKFERFLNEYNLRKINLKDLRALNESLLVNRGIDIVSASKRLGHLPSTSINYYLGQIPEEDKKASKVLENIFPISS